MYARLFGKNAMVTRDLMKAGLDQLEKQEKHKQNTSCAPKNVNNVSADE